MLAPFLFFVLLITAINQPTVVADGSFLQDTAILYKRDTLINVGSIEAILPFKINTAKCRKQKLVLILENTQLIKSPEGVYEVYVVDKKEKTGSLDANSSGFVSLLDLYSLSAPGASSSLTINISQQINRLKSKRPIVEGSIVIRYAGIKLSNGKYSTDGGQLILNHYKIVQTNTGK